MWSCVFNNGFSTSLFAVERGVSQGDPLSAYLFIIALKVLCVNLRNSNDIRGITVDNEEIIADGLTVFLKDDLSLRNFLKLIGDYGTCSGQKVNHEKSELLLLGNRAYTVHEAALNNIKINRSVKILGVHFTYDIRAKKKLNINELISSIQLMLQIWRWMDLNNYHSDNSNCQNLYYPYLLISHKLDITG